MDTLEVKGPSEPTYSEEGTRLMKTTHIYCLPCVLVYMKLAGRKYYIYIQRYNSEDNEDMDVMRVYIYIYIS
jgi:hypothetical protein